MLVAVRGNGNATVEVIAVGRWIPPRGRQRSEQQATKAGAKKILAAAPTTDYPDGESDGGERFGERLARSLQAPIEILYRWALRRYAVATKARIGTKGRRREDGLAAAPLARGLGY